MRSRRWLVVLGIETGSGCSEEAASFVKPFAHARAREAPRLLQHSVAPPSSTDGRPCWPMLPCKPLPPASSTRTAPTSRTWEGTIFSGAKSWLRPQPHHPSPAASQPLVKELWFGFGQLPGNAGITGIEMANLFRPMLGDCLVQQQFKRQLTRVHPF